MLCAGALKVGRKELLGAGRRRDLEMWGGGELRRNDMATFVGIG